MKEVCFMLKILSEIWSKFLMNIGAVEKPEHSRPQARDYRFGKNQPRSVKDEL